MADKFATIDDYIGSFPEDVRLILEKVRQIVHDAAPTVGERISYQIPAMTLDGGYLIYFAAWKHHIGLYPIPKADEALEQDLARYRAAKDTVRLPLGEPIPYDLVARLVAFLVARRGADGN